MLSVDGFLDRRAKTRARRIEERLRCSPLIGVGLGISHRNNPSAYGFFPSDVAGLLLDFDPRFGVTSVMSAVTAAGTSPPTVTISGLPDPLGAVEIDITGTGALGVPFTWKIDGVVQATGLTTAANVALSGTLAAQFPVGAYTNNDVYTANCQVSSFVDRQSALTVSQATSVNQPLYSQTLGANGQPQFSCATNTFWLDNTTTNPITSGTARTIFAVASIGSTASGHSGTLCTFRVTNPELTIQYYNAGDGNTYFGSDGATVNYSNTTAIVAGNNVLQYGYVVGSPLTFLLNGVSQTAVGNAVAETGTTGFRLLRSNAGQQWVGNFYRLLLYTGTLAVGDATRVRQYLGNLYGIVTS
jgi:hypothetical protein